MAPSGFYELGFIAYPLNQSLPNLADFIYPALTGLFLLATALRFKRHALFYRTILSHLRARPIMSEAERQLFRTLHIALGSRYSICPQLAFSAFITDDEKLRGRFLCVGSKPVEKRRLANLVPFNTGIRWAGDSRFCGNIWN